ncbi:hypothetical protein [Lacticaseibacillus saniviri]
MMNILDEFLDRHNSTRYQAAKDLGLKASTFQTASKATTADGITLRVKALLADAFGLTINEVVNELKQIEEGTAQKGADALEGNHYLSYKPIDAADGIPLPADTIFTIKRRDPDDDKRAIIKVDDGATESILLFDVADKARSLTSREYSAAVSLTHAGLRVTLNR